MGGWKPEGVLASGRAMAHFCRAMRRACGCLGGAAGCRLWRGEAGAESEAETEASRVYERSGMAADGKPISILQSDVSCAGRACRQCAVRWRVRWWTSRATTRRDRRDGLGGYGRTERTGNITELQREINAQEQLSQGLKFWLQDYVSDAYLRPGPLS